MMRFCTRLTAKETQKFAFFDFSGAVGKRGLITHKANPTPGLAVFRVSIVRLAPLLLYVLSRLHIYVLQCEEVNIMKVKTKVRAGGIGTSAG
jgi:hypothetical protein